MPTPDHVSLLGKSVSITVHLEAKESRRKKKLLKRQNWNKLKKKSGTFRNTSGEFKAVRRLEQNARHNRDFVIKELL